MIRKRTLGAGMLVAGLPIVLSVDFVLLRLLILVLIFGTMAHGLNITFGHTNQLFLFNGAIAGIGAYTTALVSINLGITPWISVWIGALLCGVIGFVISNISARRRLTIIVTSILTLSFQFAMIEILIGASSLTGGSSGIPWDGFGIGSLSIIPAFTERQVLYVILVLIVVVILTVYDYLIRSRAGLAFEAIRHDVVAASAIGIDTVKYQSIAGFAGAAIIGFAGAFLAELNGFVIPSMFTFLAIDVQLLIILVLGGRRTTLGPLAGALFVIFIPEMLKFLSDFRAPIFGLLLVVLFIYTPRGLLPFVSERVEATLSRIREYSSN